MADAPCKACGRTLMVKGRGLCHQCHGDRAIRAKYACRSAGRVAGASDGEPNAEELERMVSEQLANLPEWWERESDDTHEPIGDKQFRPVRVLCHRTGEFFFR